MNLRKTALMFAAWLLVAVPVWADWNPGDPFKMHYPQLPNPQGWDVSFTSTALLGDDWLCTQTGIVYDIHLWVSFRDNYVPSAAAVVGGTVQIWDDVLPGADATFSHPGKQLWGITFDTTLENVKLRPYGTGVQGWLDPLGETIAPPDHFTYYQLNIDPAIGFEDIAPFRQEEGKIYWLVAKLFVNDPTSPVLPEIGWKTSISPQFRDDAVFQFLLGPPPAWRPLVDPNTSDSLDLAFVITPIPEPATTLLLILGVVGIVAYSRHTR
jgi:hypothetical protein